MTTTSSTSSGGGVTRRSIAKRIAAGLLVPSLALASVTGAAASDGRSIAKLAAKYEGLPYVWAGGSPKQGFDCSGLTQYVVRKVTGLDITHSVELQWNYGSWVDYGKWKPGDLIFFQNTYKKGLSHVGIFLGRDRFVHAENEQTGVIVTDIHSAYYAERYAGARRI
ncbi:MAG: C40 family peptidase [Thermomicrobiales bacterium]